MVTLSDYKDNNNLTHSATKSDVPTAEEQM